MLSELRDRLADLHIEAEVQGRPKHYWSIYEKMVVRGKEFDDVQDLVGVRVIVDSVKDCYGALGSIHALWTPVQGRFKDYIAMPKFNLYQSLHTTVVGPEGKPVEVQIRTSEMHRRAEYGIAAHWGYKERSPAEDLAWLQRMVDWQQDTSDPTEFMETLKVDLEQDEVFVFTPKGKVITLLAGATPVDFAYAIHTEVGHRCIGARVNGRLVPLDSALSSGDTVEIFTSKVEGAGPSRDWLQFVQTPRAKARSASGSRVSGASTRSRTAATSSARRCARRACRSRSSRSRTRSTKVAEAMHYADLDALHAAIGEGHVSARGGRAAGPARAARRRGAAADHGAAAAAPAAPATAPHGRGPRRGPRRRHGPALALLHAGARATRSWGSSPAVAASRCTAPTAPTRPRSRRRPTGSSRSSGTTTRRRRSSSRSRSRRSTGRGCCATSPRCSPSTTSTSSSCTTQTATDRVARLRFDFELADPGHLDSILKAVKRVDSVYDAYRLLPGAASKV